MTANNHHTKCKGDIAVAAVILDLTKKGYIISEPMSENSPYDLICDTGNQLLRIQVKCRANGQIPTDTIWTDKRGSHRNKIDLSKFDFFALVNDDYTKICYPHTSLAGKSINWNIPLIYNEYHFWEDFINLTLCTTTRINEPQSIRSKRKQPNSLNIRTKINWPSIAEMTKLVFEKPSSILAIELGVSDVAIYRFCKKHNIKKPERGFWSK